MKELYRVTSFIIRSGVLTRHLAPWTCHRYSPFSHMSNANVLVKLTSRFLATGCRRLSSKTEINLQMNLHESATENHNCEGTDDKPVELARNSAEKPSDLLDEKKLETELGVLAIAPALPKKSFSLAAYVNDSQTLRHLVMLGVNLAQIEYRDLTLAEQLAKLDFECDVKPALLFLHDCGVKECDIGECITRNPLLLCEPIDNMQVRVNYLESKRFSKEFIARIVAKEPHVLTTATKETDTQLGYLQQDFMLSGAEVRLVVVKFPQIIAYNKAVIKDVKFTLQEFLGFSEPELKQILVADPRIYTTANEALSKRFDYIHNEMGFSHEHIVQWPSILRTRVPVLRQRHQFLKFLRRDQFDPTLENYVSPQALVTTRDVEFCNTVAKVPVKLFNDFLKTL